MKTLLALCLIVITTSIACAEIEVSGVSVPFLKNTNAAPMGTNDTPMVVKKSSTNNPPVARVTASKPASRQTPSQQVSPAVAALKEQLEQERIRTQLMAEQAKQVRYTAEMQRSAYSNHRSSYYRSSYRTGYSPYRGDYYVSPTYRSSTYFNARAGVSVSSGGRHCSVHHSHTSRCR